MCTLVRNKDLYPRNKSLVVNLQHSKADGNVYDRVGLEGDLGEGICVLGRWGSDP